MGIILTEQTDILRSLKNSLVLSYRFSNIYLLCFTARVSRHCLQFQRLWLRARISNCLNGIVLHLVALPQSIYIYKQIVLLSACKKICLLSAWNSLQQIPVAISMFHRFDYNAMHIDGLLSIHKKRKKKVKEKPWEQKSRKVASCVECVKMFLWIALNFKQFVSIFV